MDILKVLRASQVEQLIAVHDESSGLSGFLVLHDTTRGPAVGGCRLGPYTTTQAALDDAVRHAQLMTRKCALAGLDAGGASGAFLSLPPGADRRAWVAALGRYLDSLGGRMYTTVDRGLEPGEAASLIRATRYATDSERLDLPGSAAAGLVEAMRVTLAECGLGTSLAGRRVLVQGLGKLGARVARLLVEAKANLQIADLDPQRAALLGEALGIEPVSPQELPYLEADVFCPCAVAGLVDEALADRLAVRAVVAGANHAFASPEVDARLFGRGIQVAPDFVSNAGAVIAAVLGHLERRLDGPAARRLSAERVAENLRRVFEEARLKDEPPGRAAARLADAAMVRPRKTDDQWWPVR